MVLVPLYVVYVAYLVGAPVTAFVLYRRLWPRAWAWASRNRPRTFEDWVFLPIVALSAGAFVLVGVLVVAVGWPAVAVALIRHDRKARALRHALEAEEEAELLREARALRRTPRRTRKP